MFHSKTMLWALSVIALGLAAPSNAAVVSFQEGIDGYVGTSDAMLDGQAGRSHRNNGGTVLTQFGTSIAGGARPVIMRFDNLTAPAGMVVESAKLVLTKNAGGIDNGDFFLDVYQITDANAGWNAGTGSSTPLVDGDTGTDWADKIHDTDAVIGTITPAPWAGSAGLETAGTDYIAAALDSVLVDISAGGGAKYEWNLSAALVQTWIDGGTNAGLLIRKNDRSNASTFVIRTANHAAATSRPELVVTFAPPVPEPATLGLMGLGSVLMFSRRR